VCHALPEYSADAMTTELLTVQIKGLKTQLAVLEAQVESANNVAVEKPFAALHGWLEGRSACTESDFAAVEYRLPFPGESAA